MTSNDRNRGYVYVVGWEKFQHPDAVRSSHMPWLKLHTDMLGNDAWLDLSCADRTLLQGLWMLTARYGNGRCNADIRWLNGQLKIRKGSLERLNQAGFIEVRASKAASRSASNPASTDKEGSNEPKKENAREAQAPKAALARVEEEPEPAPNGFKGAEAARADFLRRTAEKQAMP